MRTRLTLRLTVLLVLTSACADADTGAADLLGDGETWILVDGAVGGVPVLGRPDAVVSLQRTPDGIGGTAACNSYFGTLSASGDRVSVGQLGQTEMGCEAPLMETEQRYLEALARVTTGVRDAGGLRLRGPGVELVYELEASQGDVALVGTRWVLDGLVDGDAVASVSSDLTAAELVLEQGGVMRASTGCRWLEGRWSQDGDRVDVTGLAVPDGESLGVCQPAYARQDQQVEEVLRDGFGFTIAGDRLRVEGPGGLGLHYRVDTATDG